MAHAMVVYPKPNEYKKPRFGFSYNWALLGTILHDAGHRVISHDYSCEDFERPVFLRQLWENRIDLVIIEFDSFGLKRSENERHGKHLVQSIKETYPEISVIAYGYYCCITGSDIPLSDLTVKQNDINAILDGIQQVHKDILLKPYDGFDSLPPINRLLLQSIPYFRKNNTYTLIETARGCGNTCVFCQRKGWQQGYIPHSYDYIMAEFKTIHHQGFKNIWIIDENFTFRLERAKQILAGITEQGITKDMKIALSSWANIDIEFLDMAAKAGVKVISFGIESGNEGILRFYRKNIDLKKAEYLIQYADSIGIFTIGNFIIGAPMETLDTINETAEFIRKCSFDQVNIKTLDYMNGSELYSRLHKDTIKGETHVFACKENGLTTLPLRAIIALKDSFITAYYQERKQRLEKKIALHGTPYD
ncbi:MAG: radical SAM protein [Spirochaetaceae bacterium]|jgi:tRNA A37 methylthiotransferase MiaB|nr:radical SAM protein [Spirochaetaceae bacterium]